MSLSVVYYNMLKWGLGPTLVSVYVSYYLDRQVCEDLPNIDHTAATFRWRLANCLGFSALAMLLFAPLLLSLEAKPGSTWETDKLRAVAFGTTFCITFGWALAAQFALRQGRRRRLPRCCREHPDSFAPVAEANTSTRE